MQEQIASLLYGLAMLIGAWRLGRYALTGGRHG